MNIDEAIKMYDELKNYKEIISNIDKNFFFDFAETVLKENFKMKAKLEKIQMLNLYVGSQDYDNEDNIIIDYEPFCLEDLEESD